MIDRIGGTFAAVCDYCGDRLPDEWDFYDAVDAKKRADWKSVQDKHGWSDCCPECYQKMTGAVADFEGVGAE